MKENTFKDETWKEVRLMDVLDTSKLTLISDTLYVDGVRYLRDCGKWSFIDRQLIVELGDIEPDQEVVVKFTVESITQFAAEMLQLNQEMKSLTHYKTGGNYASLGLKPHFLIFDEYVAFIEMLDRKQGEAVLSKLKQIAMLGRQTGFFLILACQRPDAKYLQDGLRDQFHFRVAMGKNSDLGYTMLFGDTKKKFLDMPSGRGYADMGKNIVSEFYAPFVPKGYDFLGEIQKSALTRTPSIPKKEVTAEIPKLKALKLKSSK